MRVYPEITANDVQTGDIMLEATKGILPSLIHFFQFLWYWTLKRRTPLYAWEMNHAGWFNKQHGFLHISESVARGIVNNPIWLRKKKKGKIKRILVGKLKQPLANDQENYLNIYAVANVGKHKYGFVQLLVMYPLYIIVKVFWGKVVWFESLAKGVPCGEWMAIAINNILHIFKYPKRFMPVEALSYEEFDWFELKM